MDWDDFVARGDRLGLDPSPYFSTRFYKARNPQWRGPTALHDYLRRRDRPAPHPLIDPRDYRDRYPDLAAWQGDPVAHFIAHGDSERSSPSARFDAAFYARCYLPLEGARPFYHYITQGRAAGHLPCPRPRAPEIARPDNPVIVLLHNAQPAGVPILALQLARYMRAEGMTPVFILRQGGPLLADFAALGQTLILAEGYDPAQIARALPAAPLLCATAAAAPDALAMCDGRKVMVMVHEMPAYLHDQGLIAPLRDLAARGCDLVAGFAATADTLPVGARVLRPGVIIQPPDRQRVRALRKSLGPVPVFISAGYGDHRKGFDLFLEVASDLRARRPNARFVWLGDLSSWAKTLAKGHDLILPGFVANMSDWYRAADVYLLTSRQDPGPATAAMAAGVGTPVAGYAADLGMADLLANMGRLVAPGDRAGLARAALDLVGTPRAPLRRFVRQEGSFAAYAAAVIDGLGGAA